MVACRNLVRHLPSCSQAQCALTHEVGKPRALRLVLLREDLEEDAMESFL